MSIHALPLAWRRTIAVGILLGLVATAGLLVLGPAIALIHAQSRHQDAVEAELARREALAANAPALKALVEHIDAHPLWARLYLASTDVPIASQLQTDFRALADAQAIRVDNYQPLAPQPEAEFSRVGLRVGFTTTIDRLGKLMLAMKSAPKLLRFENLYIAASLNQDPAHNALLTVRGDVVADVLGTATP